MRQRQRNLSVIFEDITDRLGKGHRLQECVDGEFPEQDKYLWTNKCDLGIEPSAAQRPLLRGRRPVRALPGEASWKAFRQSRHIDRRPDIVILKSGVLQPADQL